MSGAESGVWGFLKQRKKYWLLPLLLVFAVFALLVIASLGSEGDFVYTLQ